MKRLDVNILVPITQYTHLSWPSVIGGLLRKAPTVVSHSTQSGFSSAGNADQTRGAGFWVPC